MKIKEVKDEIIEMYKTSLSFKSSNIKHHPIRLLDSIKSIIGISPDEPVVKILNNYKECFIQIEKEEELFNSENIKPLEVVTYLDLELSLLDLNKDKSYENIFHLSRVSDGKQIFEFLIEFSLRYCNYSYLIIWSIYRMQLFTDFDNTLSGLLKCVECIIEDVKTDRRKTNESIDKYFQLSNCKHDTFDVFYSLYRIYNEKFTRSDSIRAYAITVIKEKCKFDNDMDAKNTCFEEQEKMGRQWILNYLKNIDMKNVDIEKILNLDAARGALMITKDSSKIKKIWSDLNNIYEFKENR